MAMDQFLQLASPCHKGAEDSVRSVNICVGWCRAAKTEVVSLERIKKDQIYSFVTIIKPSLASA